MHIPKKYLSSSKRTVINTDIIPRESKLVELGVIIKAKEDLLNIKSTVTLDIRESGEKDIFKEHLMLNIW